MRILNVTDFWTKAKFETNTSKTWKPFCHSAWDINMAHAVCRIQGFPSAEAALQGDKHVENDSCVLNQENNETCDFFEREIAWSCNFSNEAVAVCKGKNQDHVEKNLFIPFKSTFRDQLPMKAMCSMLL